MVVCAISCYVAPDLGNTQAEAQLFTRNSMQDALCAQTLRTGRKLNKTIIKKWLSLETIFGVGVGFSVTDKFDEMFLQISNSRKVRNRQAMFT